MKALMIGDVVGKPGRDVLRERLPALIERTAADLVVVNGENSAGGRGITPAIADEMLELGVDVISSGNHIWVQSAIAGYLDRQPRLLRPDNYPEGSPGRGLWVGECRTGELVAVLNLQGRVFMPEIDCPFRKLDAALEEIGERTALVFVDMHAEATSEKLAMGWFCDGRVTAVVGTHTHVPTADARLLPAGTAFCTDIGMTGPYDSVIGTRPDLAIERFLTSRPVRFQVASTGARISGVLIEASPDTGHSTSIRHLVDPQAGMGERLEP